MAKYHEQTNEQVSIPVDKYTTRIAYNGNDQAEYIGIALPGASESAAVWQIMKLVYTGTLVTSILWCDGNNNFDFSWTNRESYNYS